MDQQYYLCHEESTQGAPRSVLKITVEEEELICIVSGCSLSFYSYHQKGLTFRHKQEFFSQIFKVHVVPNRHLTTDLLFLLNAEGHYGFWHPVGGFCFLEKGASE